MFTVIPRAYITMRCMSPKVMAEFFKSDSKVILIAEDKSTVEMTVGSCYHTLLQTYNSLVVLFFIKQVFLQVIEECSR